MTKFAYTHIRSCICSADVARYIQVMQRHSKFFGGVAVDASGVHGLSCHFSRGQHARYTVINDILKRSLDSAKIPSLLDR